MVNAERPDYDADDLFGPEDLPQPSGSGDGIVFDSILAVPFVIDEAEFHDSTAPNAKDGDQFVVVSGRVLDNVKRVETKDGSRIDLDYGESFSTSTGSWRCVKLLRTVRDRNAFGKAVVRLARVAGDSTKKARMLEVVEKDEAAALLANLPAQ